MFEAKASIQDSLSPEILAQLAQSFGLDLEATDYFLDDFVEEYIESRMGFVTGEHLWDALWRFGVIVDDDGEWYIPDDEDTEIPLVSIDSPPKVAVAWDAKAL